LEIHFKALLNSCFWNAFRESTYPALLDFDLQTLNNLNFAEE